MELDEERAAVKTAELVALVRVALAERAGVDDTAVAEQVVHHFAEVTPPEKPPLVIRLITMSSGGIGGGRSTKPGNVFFNVRKLITALAGGVLTVAGSLQVPWMAVLAALVVWDSLWSAMQLKLAETEAAVLWALWKHRGKDHMVPKVKVAEHVSSELRAHGRKAVSRTQLQEALKKLEQMRCIEVPEDEPSQYWLREWVSISYR